MLNKIKTYFRRFGIKDAIIASLLVHLTLITDIYIINFDKVEKEQELFKGLNEKYGDGNFDPSTGEFTPTPKEETAEVEG